MSRTKMQDARRSVSLRLQTLRIELRDKMTLPELLKQGRVFDPKKYAPFFWGKSGLTLQDDSAVWLYGAVIEFTAWKNSTRHIPALFKNPVKQAGFYEVLMAAAINPHGFRNILEWAPIVVPAIGCNSYAIFRLKKGRIVLNSTDRRDHLRQPMYIGGVYLI